MRRFPSPPSVTPAKRSASRGRIPLVTPAKRSASRGRTGRFLDDLQLGRGASGPRIGAPVGGLSGVTGG